MGCCEIEKILVYIREIKGEGIFMMNLSVEVGTSMLITIIALVQEFYYVIMFVFAFISSLPFRIIIEIVCFDLLNDLLIILTYS